MTALIKADWAVAPTEMEHVLLSSVARIVSGGTPRTGEAAFWNGDIPWATPKDLSGLESVEIHSTPRLITDAGLRNSSAELLPVNSVLFSSRAPIGLLAINTAPMATNQGFKSFVPDPERLDSRYLFRWLEANRTQLQNMGVGATFKEVSKAIVSRLVIPLPPLEEQRRIAAILDKADELQITRRQALAQFDVLTQSIHHAMFGDPIASGRWSEFALNDLLSAIESGQSPVCEDRPAEAEEWGVLKLSAVTKLTFDETQNKALTSLAPKKQHEVRQGDLLFSRKNTRALVAAVALVGEVRPRLLLPDLIFRLCIRNNAVITPEYLHAVLAAPTKRTQIQNLAGGSSGSMPNISKAKLLTVKIPTPPMELQLEFGRRVAAVERLRGRHKSQLAELQALFTSLQHRAFSGEL